ncbi:MAG: general stress protein CsbD [Methylococcaceae bacterium]|nr:general stress protein CsbD [Methylococcaceae bacterium]
MNRIQITNNLKEFLNTIKDQWIWFVDDQIEVLEGKRNHLYGKTQKVYIIDSEEAEKRLADWQKLQRENIRSKV